MVGRKLSIVGAGDELAADDMAVINEAIDLRLKELHQLGTLWWQVSGTTTELTLTAGVGTVALPEDFLFPVSGMLDVGPSQMPVEFVGHRQYMAIVNKTERGEPVRAFVNGADLMLWPVPQSDGTLQLTYQAIAEDGAGATPADVPIEMVRCLSIVVASDLVDDYEINPARAQNLLLQAQQAMKTIRTLNAERVDNAAVMPAWF